MIVPGDDPGEDAVDLLQVGIRLVERVAIAVLGESLTAQLKSARDELTPLELTVVETNRERFIAALMDVNPDVIAIENPTLSRESVEDLKRLLKLSGARGGIVVYNFGASRDLEYARQAGVVAARAPLDIEQLMAAIVRAASSRPPAGRASRSKPPAESGEWQLAGPAAPHRFTQQQLATLAATTSTIDCECPQHLAQLVSNLSAFEVYSANCANRDDDDAALHRYLHHTTARARALIEEALEKVAIAEDLSY